MLIPAPAPLPVPDPTTSYWQSPPSRLRNFRSTPTLPEEVEYVIIGGGISGSSLAYHLLAKKHGAQVLLLEARDACSGASGRNGNYARFARDIRSHGIEEATKIARFEEKNVRQMAAFVKAHQNIDCLLEPVTTVDLYETGTEDLFAETLAAVAARKVAMASDIAIDEADDRTIYTASEAREKFKTPHTIGAVGFPAYSINPYRFVCGVLELALAAGLNLQTGTPVDTIHFSESHSQWIIETSRGKVQAKNVLLATNAYTSHLIPSISRIIMPVRNQAAAFRSGSKISETPFLENHSICFNYPTDQPGVRGDDYMVCKPPQKHNFISPANSNHNVTLPPHTRDIVLGGGRHLAPNHEEFNTDDSEISAPISSHLHHALQTMHFGRENWGNDEPEALRSEWTGIVGHTPDGNPYLGRISGSSIGLGSESGAGAGAGAGLFICAGFTGHGMAMAFRSAEAVTGLLLGGEAKEEVERWLPDSFRVGRFGWDK